MKDKLLIQNNSLKTKILSIILIVEVLILIMGALFLRNELSELSRTKKQQQQLNMILIQDHQQEKQLLAIPKQLSDLEKNNLIMFNKLTTCYQFSLFLTALLPLSKKCPVEIYSVKELKLENLPNSKAIYLDIGGNYADVTHFISQLKTLPYIILIPEWMIEKNKKTILIHILSLRVMQ
jgi:Tfp pilus assembly protein PilO